MGGMCNEVSYWTTPWKLGAWILDVYTIFSVLNVPTLLTNNGECSKPRLGYDIPNDLIQLVGLNTSLVDAVLKGLLVVLVLHPIAAGLSFLTLFFSLFLASHGISIFTLILAIITALVTSVVLAADLALVIVAKNKVPSLTNNGFAVNWGNGVWMVLTSLVLTWLAVIFLSARACFCCGVRRWAAQQLNDFAFSLNWFPIRKDRRERYWWRWRQITILNFSRLGICIMTSNPSKLKSKYSSWRPECLGSLRAPSCLDLRILQ